MFKNTKFDVERIFVTASLRLLSFTRSKITPRSRHVRKSHSKEMFRRACIHSAISKEIDEFVSPPTCRCHVCNTFEPFRRSVSQTAESFDTRKNWLLVRTKLVDETTTVRAERSPVRAPGALCSIIKVVGGWVRNTEKGWIRMAGGRVCNATERRAARLVSREYRCRSSFLVAVWPSSHSLPQPVARLACLRFIFSWRVPMTNVPGGAIAPEKTASPRRQAESGSAKATM